MRKLLFTILCAAAVVAANAQGTLNFLNLGQPVKELATDMPIGAGFTAQLHMAEGTTPGDAIGDPADFITGPNGPTGLFNGGTITINGVSGPGPVNLMVHASNADGTIFGWSAPFEQPLGGHGTPPAVTPGLAMGTFYVDVIPEPSHIALALLGGAALLFSRRRK